MLPVPRVPKAILGIALLIVVLLALQLNGTSWRSQQVDQQLSFGDLNGDARPEPEAKVSDNNGHDENVLDAEETTTRHGPDLPCQSLTGGAEDVLVVMRTGATELADKLPVHFDTTFKCYKNLLIFSDYAEVYRGHEIHDVLVDVAEDIKKTHEDFTHYQHVLRVGREHLSTSELSGNVSWESGPVGKTDNAGWRLDKWKFLPMMNATVNMHPDMKWYVFVEPDTYLVWSNLLKWLSGLDSTKPYYFGSEVMIGDDIFAHGGSAFVLSKPAIELGAARYREHSRDLWDFTANHWAGDCVLGRVLHDAGVELTWSWPMFQGGNPALMQWEETKGADRSLWCSPALSYHHLSPQEKRRLFEFEQDWIRTQQSESARSNIWHHTQDTVLHHRETFKSFVRPQFTADEKHDWNNYPDWQIETDDCRQLCERNSTCIQYSIGPKGCGISAELRLGQYQPGVKSGWLLDRVDAYTAGLEQCLGGSWTVP